MTQSILLVILTTLIWGGGFVATKTLLAEFPPLWMMAVRFVMALPIAWAIVLATPRLRAQASLAGLKSAFYPGVLLGAILLLQTSGLALTTVMNNSFITTFYVVLTPLLSTFFFRGPRVSAFHWLCVLIALVGTALMCQMQKLELNAGDGLTFLCAIVAAWHLIVLDRRGRVIGSAFLFNVYQTVWAGLCSLIAALALAPLPSLSAQPPSSAAVAGFLYLIGPCTLVAFALQVEAQKKLPASVIALLFLLESPFASVFGWAILGETMTALQALGAALILLAAVGAILPTRKAGQAKVAPA